MKTMISTVEEEHKREAWVEDEQVFENEFYTKNSIEESEISKELLDFESKLYGDSKTEKLFQKVRLPSNGLFSFCHTTLTIFGYSIFKENLGAIVPKISIPRLIICLGWLLFLIYSEINMLVSLQAVFRDGAYDRVLYWTSGFAFITYQLSLHVIIIVKRKVIMQFILEARLLYFIGQFRFYVVSMILLITFVLSLSLYIMEKHNSTLTVLSVIGDKAGRNTFDLTLCYIFHILGSHWKLLSEEFLEETENYKCEELWKDSASMKDPQISVINRSSAVSSETRSSRPSSQRRGSSQLPRSTYSQRSNQSQDVSLGIDRSIALAKEMQRLTYITDTFNQACSSILFCRTLLFLFNTIVWVYRTLTWFNTSESVLTSAYTLFTLSETVLTFCMLVYLADIILSSHSELTACIGRHSSNPSVDPEVRSFLHHLVLQAYFHPAHASLGGVAQMGKQLLVTLVGAGAPYMIILLQFRPHVNDTEKSDA